MQYAISPSVKTRTRKRSPCRRMTAAMREMSVASKPRPMTCDMGEMILPTPGRFFEWRQTACGPALVCPALESCAAHVFTTRHWRLGATGAHDAAAWADVARAMEVAPPNLARMRQVHGPMVSEARPGSEPAESDIIVTDDPTLAVVVQVADCAPLLLADPRSGAVAAAHAGWRGLAAQVPLRAVQAMVDRYGTRPADLLVALGPSIGACCYEVGPEVREAFARGGCSAAEIQAWFRASPRRMPDNHAMPGMRRDRPAHWFFDGWTATHDQLRLAGVGEARIFPASLCTASHPAVFCSYRRDGAPAGRMAGAIRSLPGRRAP